MRQIQFLSHQYAIATKIEIFILPAGSEKFKKIGYLSLDSNERSNYQARELKTVYTDYQTTQVKFNLLRCYTNLHNIYSQVGLIAISIFGEFPNSNTDYSNQEKAEAKFAKLEDEMIYDPATLKRLKDLYKAKYKAVELEDFDEAKRIKIAIDSLKSVSQSLIQLEERKKIAIKNDDFDAAKLIKYEIDRLRNAVAGINFQEMNKQILYDQKMALDRMQNDVVGTNIPQQPVQEKVKPQNNDVVDLQPVNNQYVMDNDEDIYRIRNVSPGYQLQDAKEKKELDDLEKKRKLIEEGKFSEEDFEDQTSGKPRKVMPVRKQVVDVDSMVVGNKKDFNQMLEEQLNDPENYKEDKKKKQGGGELSAQDYRIAEPLIPVLTFDIIKLIFSQQWKDKEEGFNILAEEVSKYPNSQLFGNQPVEQIVNACLGACAYCLTSSISNALLASMDLIKIVLNKFRTYKPDGFTKPDFDRYTHNCIRLMIEHIGDQNIKLKERAENTLLEMANYNLIGSQNIFEHFVSGEIKKIYQIQQNI